MTVPPSTPEPSPGADVPPDALRPANLSYISPHVFNAARHARIARRLRLTAVLMFLLALLITGCLIDQFALGWGRTWIHPFGQRPHLGWPGDYFPILLWKKLLPIVPVFLILLVFAGVYFFLARPVARGNRSAVAAAALVAMIHTLVAALWLLTIVVFGYNQIRDAHVWWEKALALATLAASIFIVPWLFALTYLLLGKSTGT